MADNDASAGFDSDRTSRGDAFGRMPLAKVIARQLCQITRESGFVVGIEGEWGSGKTFLLELVRSHLENQSPRPIVIGLNPWLISGTESVVCSFLTQLAAAIGADGGGAARRGIEVGRKLLGYMSALAKVAQPASLLVDQSGLSAGALGIAGKSLDTTEAAVAQFGKLLGAIDLNARKQQVVSALKQLDCPIIVVVDDLDRLPPQEIRVMFQAIKAVADFPGIVYVVAYDPDIVDQALDGKRSGGARYREKIIQVAYQVPHLHSWVRAEFLRDRLDEVVRGCIEKLPVFVDQQDYDRAVSIASRLCVHPRDVVRLCNRLRIDLVAIGDNINTADLIAIEALAFRFPKIAKAMREHPSDYAKGWHSLDVMDEQEAYEKGFLRAVEREGQQQAEWERHLPDNIDEKVLAAKVCEFLFGKGVDDDRRDRKKRNRHVREPHLLALYCALGQDSGFPTPRSIEELFCDPAKLRAKVEEEDFEAWLSWVKAFPPTRAVPDPEQTLDVLIEAARKYKVSGQRAVESVGLLGEIWGELVISISEKESIANLFQRLIATAPLSMSCVPVIRAVRECGFLSSREQDRKPVDERFVKDEGVVNEVIVAWQEKVREEARSGDLAKEPSFLHILYRWRQLPGSTYREVWQLVDGICSTPEGLNLFLHPYRNKGDDQPIHIGEYFDLVWDREGLIQRVEQFSLEDQYKQLIEALRADEVIQRHSALKKAETAEDRE